MKGNGNDLKTLFRKLYFMCLPTSGQRSKYVQRHKFLFKNVGGGIFFQPRQFPSDPELISFGDNVMIASGVSFINHDITNSLFNRMNKDLHLVNMEGCIEIGNNVMIGAKSIIMPNVKIGNNVIVAAGSIVTKDIDDNLVVGGIPAKPIGDFNSLMNKRIEQDALVSHKSQDLWDNFYKQRGNDKK